MWDEQKSITRRYWPQRMYTKAWTTHTLWLHASKWMRYRCGHHDYHHNGPHVLMLAEGFKQWHGFKSVSYRGHSNQQPLNLSLWLGDSDELTVSAQNAGNTPALVWTATIFQQWQSLLKIHSFKDTAAHNVLAHLKRSLQSQHFQWRGCHVLMRAEGSHHNVFWETMRQLLTIVVHGNCCLGIQNGL